MEKPELIDEELISEEEPKKKRRKRKFFTRKRKRQLKYLSLFILLLLAMYLLRKVWLHYDRSPIGPQTYTIKYPVEFLYVSDGDTAVFRNEEGQEITCRFLAVDTPEITEPGYEEAKEYTRNVLAGSDEIILELDPDSAEYDHYERLLAWVWADGRLLQEKLVEKDLAEIAYLYGDYLYTAHLTEIAAK